MKKYYVFTYGTLMKGERNHHLISDDDYIDKGVINGFKMFNLGTYPGISSGMGSVLGELYLVDETTLAKIDELEEEGSLYVRRMTKVYTSDLEYDAYVYIYNKYVNNPIYLGNKTYSWKNRIK